MGSQNIARLMSEASAAPITDPGASGSYVVDITGSVVGFVTATGETRTLAAPTKVGLMHTMYLKTDGGNATITVTGGYDQAGNTTITFSDAGDYALLQSIDDNGTIRWQLIHYISGSEVVVTESIQLADSDQLQFGTGSDITMAWDGTDFDVLQATADSSIKWGIDGAGIDQVHYGDTAGSNMTWDQSADALNLTDSTPIQIGDSQDIKIEWNGTNLTSGSSIAQSTNNGLWSGCPSAIDPDPYRYIYLFEDFNIGSTDADTPLAGWEEVDDGTTGTNAYSSTIHSCYNIVTAAANDDYHTLVSGGYPVDLVNNKAVWLEARFKLTEAATNQATWWFGFTSDVTTGGMQAAEAGPLATYDGAMIYKLGGALTVDAETSNAGTQDTETTIGTFVSGNWTRVGLHITAAATTGVMHVYMDPNDSGTMTAHSATMNITRAGLVPCRVVMGVNSGGSAETLSVDYIKVVQER
jgi:hypothetical protein